MRALMITALTGMLTMNFVTIMIMHGLIQIPDNKSFPGKNDHEMLAPAPKTEPPVEKRSRWSGFKTGEHDAYLAAHHKNLTAEPHSLSFLEAPVNADLRVYYERKFPPHTKMPHCDPEAGSVLPGCVYILGDTLTPVFRQQWYKTADTKIAAFEIMIDSILERMRPQFRGKNISFALELRANGTMWITRRRRFEPLLTLAQRDRNVGGLSGLIPNPYFLNLNWWTTYITRMTELAKSRPWESRKKQVLFRGACGPGGQERLKLMLLRKNDSRLDVGFSRTLGNYNDSLAACVHDVGRSLKIDDAEIEAESQVPKFEKMMQEDFSNYQYVLQMPGAATGAYSRGLQYLFLHGSIVLIWESDSIEFYYHQLVPGKHYMPVNRYTLSSVLDDIQANPALQKTLLAGAKDAYQNIVSADNVYQRWRAAFEPILKRQTEPMVLPPDACSCSNLTGIQTCKHCEYVNFLKGRVRHYLGKPDVFDYSKF